MRTSATIRFVFQRKKGATTVAPDAKKEGGSL